MTVDQIQSPNDAHLKNENKITSQDVGLIFAREYYTFLNKRPNRLHAFYGSDSLLVRGDEGETVSMVKGQEEIRKKIEELEFDNCKVLVTQVDSQLSANDGVLISVLGEISNKDKPSQKFVETFFLAPQVNGYYILNSIFRFLKDKVDIDYYLCEQEEMEETPPAQVDCLKDISQPNQVEVEMKEVKKEVQPVITKAEENNEIEIKKVRKEDKSSNKVTPMKEIEKETHVAAISPNLSILSAPVVQEKASAPPVVIDKPTPAATIAAPNSITSNVTISSVVENNNSNTNNTKKAQPYHVKDNASQMSNGYNARDQRGFQKTTTNSQTWARLAASTASESVCEPTGPTKPLQQHHYHNQQQDPPTQQIFPSTLHVQNNNMPHGNNYNHHPQQNSHHPPQQQNPNAHQQHAQNQQQPHYQHHNKEQQQQQQQQHQRSKDTQIFVKNVNSTMTDEQLEQAFNRFGPIKNVNIGHLRNCAFIDFMSVESTQRALDQHKVMVGAIPVFAEERRPPKHFRPQFDNNNNRRYQQNRRGGGASGTSNRGGTAGVAAPNKRGGGVTGPGQK